MLLERSLSNFCMTSLKQHTEYFQFQYQIQLELPVQYWDLRHFNESSSNNDLTICIILTTLVIKPMRDFMANDAANGAKVQVTGHLEIK